MGGVSRAELVIAVTEAGGFGFLGMVREPVALIRAEVEQVRQHTNLPFGVNLIPAATEDTLLEAQIATCIELKVPVIGLFWDLSAPLVQRLREAGMIVVCQVGSVTEALAAQAAGANALIAQGCEAGGHVRGDVSIDVLLSDIVAAVDIPALAAGGIASGADLATMLALGAQGGVVGTAMIATHESFAHNYHKERLVAAKCGDTLLTDVFHINWPMGAKVRVLANSVTRGEHGDPFTAARTMVGHEADRPFYLFSTDSPLRSMTGDFEAMALYAGTGVRRIDAITGAGEKLHQIVREATALLEAGVAR
ncbi:nitronate monooxygenase family protein, partial [Acidiphilium sp. 20-67-58]|uniref:NAD(P)H-dependent flavin oxidoreductase n=1 Tax=Acidiphilium sp. 20-67-58 TaxID=1970291 RepID=UPI0025BEAF2A